MSDMDQKRDYVSGLYPGQGWKKKVRNMPDSQVFAIYMREVNKAKERAPKPKKKESDSDGIPF